jgi:hypothetical protein
MSAEAVVDFIGEDKKLLSTLQGIEKRVQGMGSGIGSALKAGMGLIAVDKIKEIGAAAIQAAAQTDKYKEKWKGVSDTVNDLLVAIGGPLIDAMEKLIPIAEQLTAKLEEWGPAIADAANAGAEAWTNAQRKIAGAVGALMPGVSYEDAVDEFDRQIADADRAAKRRSDERKQKAAQEATFKAPTWENVSTEFNRMIAPDPGRVAFNQTFRGIGGMMGGAAGMMAKPAGGSGDLLDSIGKSVMSGFKGLANSNLGLNIQGAAGGLDKFAGKGLNEFLGEFTDKEKEDEPQAFSAGIEDLRGLFSRVQSGAASTPELDEAKKTANNTKAMQTGISSLVTQGQQLLTAVTKGIPSVLS